MPTKDQGTTDNGWTPLIVAAQNGHLEIVRFLDISGGVWCQQRPRHNWRWMDASYRGSSACASSNCPISGGVWCQQRPRHNWCWMDASYHSSSEWASWNCPISRGVRCQQKTKAQLIMDGRLLSWQLRMGILKLSDFRWGPVPTKNKAQLIMDGRLLSWQLRMGILRLSDF